MTNSDRVEMYEDEAGDWRWHRWSAGRIVAESGEGYANESWCAARAQTEADAHHVPFTRRP